MIPPVVREAERARGGLGEEISDESRVEVAGQVRYLMGDVAGMSVEDEANRRVVTPGQAHVVGVGQDPEQTAGMVNQLIAGIACGDRLVEIRCRGDFACEVPVEEISVACVPEQPGPGSGAASPAEFLDNSTI